MGYEAERGVLYVAYGENARQQAGISIKTLREVDGDDLPVAVVAAERLTGADIDIIEPEADLGGRVQKTRMYELSPFELTLFLDADTEVLSTTDQAFALLEYVDIVLGQDPKRRLADMVTTRDQAEERQMTRREIGTEQWMYYNSGVIAFRRNERVEALMTGWHEEWMRWQMTDQMAFARALAAYPVRIATMRWAWNTHRKSEARFIYHKFGQARRTFREDARRLAGRRPRPGDPLTAAMRRNLGMGRPR